MGQNKGNFALIRGFMGDIVFMNNLKGKLEYRRR
jgi:hypothetical protein